MRQTLLKIVLINFLNGYANNCVYLGGTGQFTNTKEDLRQTHIYNTYIFSQTSYKQIKIGFMTNSHAHISYISRLTNGQKLRILHKKLDELKQHLANILIQVNFKKAINDKKIHRKT